jgi:hypothetical protein
MNTSHFKMVCRHVIMTEDYIVKNDTNILYRYEHPRHSKTEARKPTARKQGCAKSMRQDIPGKPHSELNLLLTICQEFNSLADDANIYKLVGPVLLKQDTTEAKSTVDGRLEYIGGEMYERTTRLHLRSGRNADISWF